MQRLDSDAGLHPSNGDSDASLHVGGGMTSYGLSLNSGPNTANRPIVHSAGLRDAALSPASGGAASGDDIEEDYEDIVVANNVHKTYLLGVEGVPALRGVSLSIRKGEFVVILGKSGGGKTSMLNIIGTIDKPTKGELEICGKRITSKTSDAEFALLRLRKIGFVFQTFNLISSMTALENVELPMILDGRLSKDSRRKRAIALLTRVGMAARLDHTPSQMSGGEQQRVTIARAISNSPELLLLDEPTGDLDTVNSHIILQMLLDLNRKHGITCVMVTHDQQLASFAHRVVHMVDGKIFKIEVVSEQARSGAEQELAGMIGREAEKRVEEAVEVRNPFAFYSFSHALQRLDDPRHKSNRKPTGKKGRTAGLVAEVALATHQKAFTDTYA